MNKGREKSYASGEQVLLAKLLKAVVIFGLSFIVIGFVLFVSGALPSVVSVEEVAGLWHLSSGEYLDATGIPTGWGWMRLLANGDMISFGTLVLISLAAIVSIAIVAIHYVRSRNWIYAAIVSAQTLILILAASGIVSGH